jgi:hypothetical protein
MLVEEPAGYTYWKEGLIEVTDAASGTTDIVNPNNSKIESITCEVSAWTEGDTIQFDHYDYLGNLVRHIGDAIRLRGANRSHELTLTKLEEMPAYHRLRVTWTGTTNTLKVKITVKYLQTKRVT